ncbi:hypothetical protein BFP77_16575 [Maribacter sp. 4U21]|nr:hypothetical protein BFP77_16575 [Maribacter sp. 4U21]
MAVLTIGIEGTYRPGATINYSTSNVSALAREDYSSVSETYTLATEDITSFDIIIPITDDNLIEPSESFSVNFAHDTPAVSATASVSVSITDNDNGANKGVSINDFTVNEDVGTANFTVSLNGNLQNSFTIDYNLLDGSATEAEDYTGSSGTITFTGNDGESHVINVPIIDDSIIEETENLEGKLSNLSTTLINIVDANGVGTITDNDGGAGTGVSVSDFTVDENAGTATFDVTLNADVQGGFNVDFDIADGSAVSPDDNTVANTDTFVTFPAGTATGDTQLVTINIVDDTIIENTETLDIALTFDAVPPVGVNMLDDTGVGTITDNDAPGMNDGLYIDDLQVNEQTGVATVTVRVQGSFTAFNVDYATNDGGGTATATAGGVDYTASNGTLAFAEGQSSITFNVVIIDDCLIESTEVFFADLLNAPDFVPVIDGNATITIIDDEEALASSDFEAEITSLCGDETSEDPQLTFTGGSGDYEVLFSEEIQNASDSEDFMIIRTWDVTDSCDNTASFKQIIFVLQPQLQEITIDICIEDEAIDLVDYLPEGFDTNGVFEVTEGDVMLDSSIFVPEGLELGEYRIAYTSTGEEFKYYVDFTVTTNRDCVAFIQDGSSKAVTANGDGVNDMFEIRGAEYCDYNFDVMIFNRWGNMVYEGKDYKNDWGGFAPNNSFGKSGFLPTGTYYYIIIVVGADFKQLNRYIYLGAE